MNALIDDEIDRAADLFREAITAQVEAAARAVRTGDSVADALDRGGVAEAYTEAYTAMYLLAASEVYNAIDNAQKDYDPEQYEAWERAVAEHISVEGGSQITLIDNHTKQWVMDTVAAITREAVDEGLGTDEIAARLISKWDELDEMRALRIAQTEMNSAANTGSMRAAIDSGMTHKMWITAGDHRVRSSHRDVEKGPIPIEQAFNNGLMRPSDPASNNAGEVINCRCQLGYSRL